MGYASCALTFQFTYGSIFMRGWRTCCSGRRGEGFKDILDSEMDSEVLEALKHFSKARFSTQHFSHLLLETRGKWRPELNIMDESKTAR